MSLFLTMALTMSAGASVPDVATGDGVDYNDYLAGHNAESVFDFAKNETAASQPLSHGKTAGYSGDYGHKGCTIAKKYEVGAEQ